MSRLHEKEVVQRSRGAYYIDPERVESLKHPERVESLKRRLESLDAAVDLFNDTPDDVYAKTGWEDELPELDPSEASDADRSSDIPDTTNAETLVVNREVDTEE